REQALKQAHSILETVVNSSPLAITSIDRERRVKMWNPAAEKLFGWKREEIVGKVLPVIQEDRKSEAAEIMEQVFRGETIYGMETVRLKRDGTPIDIRLYATSLGDDEMMGISADVTDLKKTEEALRQSEKKFRNIIESNPMGMILYRLEDDGRLVFSDSNPSANEIFGVDISGHVGKTIEEAFPALADTEIPGKFSQVASTGDPWFSEQVDYDHDKIKGAFEVHAFQSSPGITAVSFLDVTERKKAETKVRESERRYRLMADNISDVIWTMDMNFNYTYISPSVEKMRGFTPEEAMKHNLEDSLTRQSVRKTKEAIARHLELVKSGKVELDQPIVLEMELLCKDGSTVWGEAAGTLVGDEAGNPVGIQGMTRDISERKLAERALLESEERFRTVFRKSPDALAIMSAKERIFVDVSDGFRRITGYSRDEAVGKSPADLDAWVDKDLERTYIERLRSKGSVEP
ncbi:PAS domain S-box protein, partial [bacterium]|nr:PAS domain S-box protein [bacterium]